MRAAGCWDNSPAAARRNYGPSPPVPRRQPREPARKPDYRHVSVTAYGASVAAYGTPAAGYLDRRGVWPESRSDELPASVRWLPARLAPTEIRGSLADYLAHPDAVAGLAMYVYRTREGELTCAKFEAISSRPPANGSTDATVPPGNATTGRWRAGYSFRSIPTAATGT